MKKIELLFDEKPKFGDICEIKPGIYWFPVDLPMMGPDYVNCYILQDYEDVVIFDSGANLGDTKAIWESVLKRHFPNKKVKYIVVTHHHPDHIGLAGWLSEKYSAPLYCTRTAFMMAKMLSLDVTEKVTLLTEKFWKRAGMEQHILSEKLKSRPFNFGDGVYPLKQGFIRIKQNDDIYINGVKWEVKIGNGHAPEHATFWSEELDLIIAGDQVLPGISSNLGVYPNEPEADTVGDWIESCDRFLKESNDEQVVLPGHGVPFSGLPRRLNQLIDNHKGALARIRRSLEDSPKTAVGLFRAIFKRDINKREYLLALHEAVGHVNHLYGMGELVREERDDGALIYSLLK
jgi:glyoxylase-like metal-dependent hydrolase (beta-lactamase superfamily II)